MRFRVCSIYLYGYPELTLVRDLRTDVVSGIVGTETARGVWEVGWIVKGTGEGVGYGEEEGQEE